MNRHYSSSTLSLDQDIKSGFMRRASYIEQSEPGSRLYSHLWKSWEKKLRRPKFFIAHDEQEIRNSIHPLDDNFPLFIKKKSF